MNLTKEQQERLALLIEECAEVQQAATKILRHGFESINPDDPDKTTNRWALEKEISHLQIALELLRINADTDPINISWHMRKKRDTINNWLHFNEVDKC